MRSTPVVLQHVELAATGGCHHRAADARHGAANGGAGVIGELIERFRWFLGDDERVPGTERIDVEEGEHVLVLVHLVTGDRAGEDLGEDGLGHGRQPSASVGRWVT